MLSPLLTPEPSPDSRSSLPLSFGGAIAPKSAPARKAALLRAEDGRTDFSSPIRDSFENLREARFSV